MGQVHALATLLHVTYITLLLESFSTRLGDAESRDGQYTFNKCLLSAKHERLNEQRALQQWLLLQLSLDLVLQHQNIYNQLEY